jgi:N-methylhydantoinase A
VDDGGLLHVGPQSAGAAPGPACYGRGGTRATVTDAALTLGYLDPDYFLGGGMRLNLEAAHAALDRDIGGLGMDTASSAAAVMTLVTEHMARAIEEITVNRGVDPAAAVLVGGGGAAGLNSLAIARRLGCRRVVFPDVGAVLSAAGGLMSDLSAEFTAALPMSTSRFDAGSANAALSGLGDRARRFAAEAGQGALATTIQLSADARYPHQVSELEVSLPAAGVAGADDVEALRQRFHAAHEEVFAIKDPDSPVEIVGWRARVRCRLRGADPGPVTPASAARPGGGRPIFFADHGWVDARVRQFDAMATDEWHDGPLLVESPVTTVVVDPGAAVARSPAGSLVAALPGRPPSRSGGKW